jgi:SNF2 family DNA or RNA helicase
MGSYEYDVFYLPKVNLLKQLSLDPRSLWAKHTEQKKQKKMEKGLPAEQKSPYEYHSLTIKVPVPPPTSQAMLNPRTGARFPLGQKVDPETGEELKELETVLEERTIRNQIIYTNVDDGVVYYVDKDGALATYNVGYVSQLQNNRNLILRILETKVKVSKRFKSGGSTHTWDSDAAESAFYVDPDDMSPDAIARRERLQLRSGVDLAGVEVTQKDGSKVRTPGGVPLFQYAVNNDFKKFVEYKLSDIDSKIKKGASSVRGTQLGSPYAKWIVAALFASEHPDLFSDLLRQEESTASIRPENAPEIPHVKADTRYLPHQAYGLSFLKEKKAAMIDADPGAGKTLLMLSDILDKMHRGLVSRPCLVMPNNLLSQQKREMEEWTGYSVNFIVIETKTVKRQDPEAYSDRTGVSTQGGNHDRGFAQIRKLVARAPKNTIVMTSYDWIRGQKDNQSRIGDKVVFHRARWISSWTDMLVLDESHNVRIGADGKESLKAQAIMQMSTLVPYKRCYTGTMAPSGPDDIFLQMKFLDPSVLGSRTDFKNKYALSEGKKKKRGSSRIEHFRKGAIKEIRELVTRRVGLSIRRSAWLAQLPQLKVNYHPATLTVAQLVCYRRIMERILKEELGDLEPGSVGLSYQAQQRSELAADPVGRSKINSWEAPTTVSVVAYSESEDEHVPSPDLHLDNSEHMKEFNRQRNRAIVAWKQYEELPPELTMGDDFLPLLQKFIALDRFINNPLSDDFGRNFLVDPKDHVSSKVKVVDEILENHFADPANGKVIIFTLYKDTAAHMIGNMKMASSAIYYDSNTPKNLDAFKTDPSVRVLVAVEQSIREGQNLQMANRIIRIDLPWNPGAYEQAIARAYRLPPRDPNAERYSVVNVDIILADGTAEVTKFLRMVSKMHKVRQLISGFEAKASFDLVKMSLTNMQTLNTFKDHMPTYINVYSKMREQELLEAKDAPDLYGTRSYSVATGEKMEGSGPLETPVVESDLDRNPESIDLSGVDPDKLVKPTIIYFNGAFWLTLRLSGNMENILRGFNPKPLPRFLFRKITSREDSIKAIQDLVQSGIQVQNVAELAPMLAENMKDRQPVDPSHPGAVIDFGNIKKRASPDSDFVPAAPENRQKLLDFRPEPGHFSVALSLLQKASGGKKIRERHHLAAAKVIGLMEQLRILGDPKKFDPTKLWKGSKHFSLLNKKVLQEQVASLFPASPVPPAATPGVPAPAAVPGAQPGVPGAEDGTIEGLDIPVAPGAIPIKLHLSLLGSVEKHTVNQIPGFSVSDHSSFTRPGYTDKIFDILRANGFSPIKQWGEGRHLLFMGDTREQAAKSLKKFGNRLYFWYFLEDPEDFARQLSNFGLSLEDVWKKMPVHAMLRVAETLDSYPEYRMLIRHVLGV